MTELEPLVVAFAALGALCVLFGFVVLVLWLLLRLESSRDLDSPARKPRLP